MKELKPIEFKYRKFHNFLIKKKLKKKEFKHFKLKRGFLGLKSLNGEMIDSKQILSCLKVLTRTCKRRYKLWLYCFPNVSITAKSISVRMGTGIGNIINWIYILRKNNIFLEMNGWSKLILIYALNKAKKKLKVFSKIIIRKK